MGQMWVRPKYASLTKFSFEVPKGLKRLSAFETLVLNLIKGTHALHPSDDYQLYKIY